MKPRWLAVGLGLACVGLLTWATCTAVRTSPTIVQRPDPTPSITQANCLPDAIRVVVYDANGPVTGHQPLKVLTQLLRRPITCQMSHRPISRCMLPFLRPGHAATVNHPFNGARLSWTLYLFGTGTGLPRLSSVDKANGPLFS